MRARTTVTFLVLLLVALASAGAVVYAVQAERVEERITTEVDQEIAEFRKVVDEVSRNGGTATESLRVFLQRSVPGETEVFSGWVNGTETFRQAERGVLTVPAFHDEVAALVAAGESGRSQVPGIGEVLVTVQPIDEGSVRASLVIVTLVDEARSSLYDTMRTYALVSAVLLVLVGLLAAWQVGRLMAPLGALRSATDRLTATDLSERVEVRGNDDITALTRAWNEMLDRLETSFTAQQQFLDDAGHELRTPLTVLRGHLELLDVGQPDEIAETRDLLLDETDRMGRLVGDLILLAKSRRPDFVRPAPVELADLVPTVLAKARGMAEREWTLDEVAPGLVHADPQRLTQALLQLVDNAVKHTATGAVVALGASRGTGTARIWVRDTGAGVPEADRTRIFERFGRAEVPDGDEGFGLGLSIVSAIVAASGGSVAVEDPPPPHPPGALFVVTLPLEEEPWPPS